MKKTIQKTLAPVIALGLFAALATSGRAAVTIDNSTYRIAVSHDGNAHDRDDLAAAPMVLAMLAEAGVKTKLVHFDYNNHLGGNVSSKAQAMRDNVASAKQRWAIANTLYDCQTNLSGATTSLKNAINASTSTNRLYIACLGPMEVPWRGINASNSSARTHVTAITHSPANNTHDDTAEMSHSWTSIEASGVKTVQITHQGASTTRDDFDTADSKWYWLRDSSNANRQWLYGTEIKSGQFDVSDAGIVWYIITGRGDQLGTPAKVQDMFNGIFTTN